MHGRYILERFESEGEARLTNRNGSVWDIERENRTDTHALALFFNALAGKPRLIYIMGHSMGGHVTGVAIEQYPELFDGAVPMCGVMGDCELFDSFLDYHAVAQWLTETEVDYPYPENY